MDKLFLNNSYIREFTANITNVSTEGGRILLVLDRTGFYPEGGGQPPDTGLIGECKISHVFEEDGVIYHVSDKIPDKLYDVTCGIDWERRLDHMQQHCGQHILSASFDKLLKGTTVGFHLGSEYVTIDVEMQSLSYQDARRVEELANSILFENRRVVYHYPKPDELENYNLRKAPSVAENIRIVEVEGFDCSPCGGTHPSQTGDVGIIKIRRWEKYKDYIRVEFLCGSRALRDYGWKNDCINEISGLISSRDMDVLDNVKKSIDELKACHKEMRMMKDTLLAYEARELANCADVINGVRIIKKAYTGRDFKEITSLASKISRLDSVIALIGLKSDNAQMIFTRSSDIKININELFKEVLPVINGRGGGSPQTAQGGGSDISNLESALDSAYVILKNRHLK